MKYKTNCDMGSIKIFNKDLSLFFNNGLGDFETIVEILDKEPKHKEFLGHFTVKTKAYLSNYDCEDKAIHTFEKGRYFVYLIKELHLAIVKVGEDINA